MACLSGIFQFYSDFELPCLSEKLARSPLLSAFYEDTLIYEESFVRHVAFAKRSLTFISGSVGTGYTSGVGVYVEVPLVFYCVFRRRRSTSKC